MLFEPSEHEPDEYDPEDDLEDSEADGPTIPQVSTDGTDVPGELLRTFWIVVGVVNVAVLALSLGALFLVFRGDATTGGGLLAGGVVLVALAVRRYRALDDDHPDQLDDATDSSDSGDDERADVDGRAAETVSGSGPVVGPSEESTSDDENRT